MQVVKEIDNLLEKIEKKIVAKVDNCTFSVAILTIIAGGALIDSIASKRPFCEFVTTNTQTL
jgi:hypothetical protein